MSEPDTPEVIEQFQKFPCPVCGAFDWGGVGDLYNLLVALPLKTPQGEQVRTTEDWASLDVLPFVCGTCGFLRFHAKQTLEALAKARKEAT
jgi:hypothetical protein